MAFNLSKIEVGKNIVNDNPFYNTLSLFLKYYFIKHNEKDFYLVSFIKDITSSELEFKTFMIFKEYSLYIYHTELPSEFKNILSIDDIVYTIIYYVKKNYDKDRNVIKQFIISINNNHDDIIEKFHFIKNTYIFKVEALSKFEKLKNAIFYLEQAKEFEEKAKHYRHLAMEHLYDIKNYYEHSLKTLENQESSKILSIKNF
jgi:hypothetical protein